MTSKKHISKKYAIKMIGYHHSIL